MQLTTSKGDTLTYSGRSAEILDALPQLLAAFAHLDVGTIEIHKHGAHLNGVVRKGAVTEVVKQVRIG